MRRRTFLRNGLWILGAPSVIASPMAGAKFSALTQAKQGSSCTTIAEDDSAGGSSANVNFAALGQYFGYQFTAGATYSLCKMVLQMSTNTAPVSADLSIWTDNGANAPNAKIGTGSSVVDLSVFGAQSPVTFPGMAVNIVSGTIYWMVLHSSIGNNGAVNWFFTAAFTHRSSSSTDGVTWFSFSTLTEFDFTSYK